MAAGVLGALVLAGSFAHERSRPRVVLHRPYHCAV